MVKTWTTQDLVDVTPTEKIEWVEEGIDTRGRNIPIRSSSSGTDTIIKSAAERTRQIEQQKQAEEQRRIAEQRQAEQKRIQAGQQKVSAQVAATRQRSIVARTLREEAQRRNLDISTPAREIGFLKNVKESGITKFTANELKSRGIETTYTKELPPETIERKISPQMMPFSHTLKYGSTMDILDYGTAKTSQFFLKQQEKIGTKLQQSKIGQSKIGNIVFKDIKVPKQTAEDTTSDILKFSIFSPSFSTTTQVEKQIAERTDVIFTGTTQKVSSGLIKTDIGFVTSEGKVGVARGLSKVKLSDDIIKSITIGEGKQTTKIGVKFPSSKIVAKTEKFVGVEKSLSKIKEDKFLQVTKGITFNKKMDASLFESIGIGKIKDKKTIFVGGIFGDVGNARLGGIIKRLPSKEKGNIIKITGDKISKQITKQTQTSLQNIVTSAVQKPIKPVSTRITPLSVTSISKNLVNLKTIQQPKTLQKTIQQPKTTQIIGLDSLTGQKQRKKQIPKSIQISKTQQFEIQKPRLAQKSKQIQRQKQGVLTLQRLHQKNLQRQINVYRIFKPKTPKNAKPITSFKLLSPRTTKQKGYFDVKIRRYGKFKSLGSNLTLKQAISLGQQKVSTGLGATFKLTGKGIGNIRTPFGFYTKPTKQGTLFIERPKYRLSTIGEVREIQTAKRRRRK